MAKSNSKKIRKKEKQKKDRVLEDLQKKLKNIKQLERINYHGANTAVGP